MKKETLLVLLDKIFSDKLEEIKKDLIPIKGERGLRGKSGTPFDFESNKEEIVFQIKEYIETSKENYKLKFSDLTKEEIELIKMSSDEIDKIISKQIEERINDLKLHFSDLTEEEKESLKLRGPRGMRGQKGKSGKDFIFEEHIGEIEKLLPKVEDLKLHFADLTEEEKDSLKVRGQKGKPGKDFIFEEHIGEIEKLLPKVEDLKLHFSDLTEEEKDSLKVRGSKGERGLKGSRGESFNFDDNKDEISVLLKQFFDTSKSDLKLKFEDLTEDEKNKLKLKFEDLTEDEKNSLRIRGPRGQRGKAIKGEDGTKWLLTKDTVASYGDMFLDTNNFDIFRFSTEWELIGNIKGKDGIGVRGTPGVTGVTGARGIDGVDGLDAPTVVDIKLKKISNKIYFIFYFSDGTELETDRIDLPKSIQALSVVNNSSVVSSSSNESAKRLEVDRIVDEPISIGEFVTATSGTNIALAQSNVEAKAVVLGMALTNGNNIGDKITILLFGNYINGSLSYSINEPLFLTLNGLISTTIPLSGWITRIATGNGNGSMFIKVEEPIEI